MHLFVGGVGAAGEFGDVVAARVLHAAKCLVDLVAPGIVTGRYRSAQCHRFEHRAQLVNLLHLLDGDLGDPHAPLGQVANPALTGEPGECLPQGRGADREPVGQCGRSESITGFELVREDRVPELVGHAVGQRLRVVRRPFGHAHIVATTRACDQTPRAELPPRNAEVDLGE